MGWLDKIFTRTNSSNTVRTDSNIVRTNSAKASYFDRKTGKQIPAEDVVVVKDDKGHVVGYRMRKANESKKNESGNTIQGAYTGGAGSGGPAIFTKEAQQKYKPYSPKQNGFAPHQGID